MLSGLLRVRKPRPINRTMEASKATGTASSLTTVVCVLGKRIDTPSYFRASNRWRDADLAALARGLTLQPALGVPRRDKIKLQGVLCPQCHPVRAPRIRLDMVVQPVWLSCRVEHHVGRLLDGVLRPFWHTLHYFLSAESFTPATQHTHLETYG